VAERSKKHHFVPKMLLKGFASKDQVRVQDLQTKSEFLGSIENLGAINDYNTIETNDGPSDLAEVEIERLIEGPAVAVIERIRNGGWIDSQVDRQALASSVAFQYTRVPGVRDSVNAVTDKIAKRISKIMGTEGLAAAMHDVNGAVPSPEEVRLLRDWMGDDSNWYAEQSREQHILQSLDPISEASEILMSLYHWGVVRWPDRSLVTSDSPVLMVPFESQGPYGVGLGTAQRIYLGLGRRLALVLVNRRWRDLSDGFELNPTPEMAFGHNRNLAASATRWIYHHPDDSFVELFGDDFSFPDRSRSTRR
jgi:Protein of unknown function (DUF4238)